MKTLKMLAMAMAMVALTAGFAVAQDDVTVSVDNHNDINNTATGGNANQNQGQDQRQQQVMKTPTQLMNLQYGTNFVNPGLGIQNKGWSMYHSAVYAFLSYNDVKRMRREFQMSDLFFFWKASRVKVQMISDRLKANPVGISLMNYWPKDVVNSGDKVIAAVRVKGEAEWNEESFLGLAAEACIEQAGSDRFAVLSTMDFVGVSNGMSISMGGTTSSVFSAGTKGAVITGGGQIGTIETSVEERDSFKVLCMNPGPLNYYPPNVKPQPAPPVIQTPAPQQPSQVCDPAEIFKRIEELKREVIECKLYCYNNLMLRKALVDAYIELYVCTEDVKYLNSAIYNAEIAERNYFKGHDIKAHKAQADAVIAEVYYNQAGVIYELHGKKVALQFAKAKHLERIPMGFVR